jgi:metal-dependent amidase/aminoacylase/carboxypeptidase family protein
MTNLLINDLVESKELDRSAMLAVRGGTDLTSFNAQALAAEAHAGIAAITAATQTLVSLNTSLNLDISPVTNVVVGGLA